MSALPLLLPRYESALPLARDAARSAGYALAFHGSGQRDLDVIAVPWIEGAIPPGELALEIARAVGGGITADETVGRPKPHGRLCWVIYLGGKHYIDLSVIPPTPGG